MKTLSINPNKSSFYYELFTQIRILFSTIWHEMETTKSIWVRPLVNAKFEFEEISY